MSSPFLKRNANCSSFQLLHTHGYLTGMEDLYLLPNRSRRLYPTLFWAAYICRSLRSSLARSVGPPFSAPVDSTIPVRVDIRQAGTDPAWEWCLVPYFHRAPCCWWCCLLLETYVRFFRTSPRAYCCCNGSLMIQRLELVDDWASK